MIRVLDPETVGQIAAGEVVERPLSVVKELVENALDAHATRIVVRVRVGGLAEIEVADDGVGIAAVDLPVAFVRHATSKLISAAGLTDIGTLGFRGEGLAAIAAVSSVTIVSRERDAEIGTAIEAHGETIGAPHPMATPPGTRVIVRDLFGNVPVRREYLRTPSAEFSRIATWLSTLALAYPDVGFTLEHDGRQTFAFAPGEDLMVRLMHVFGRGAEAMVPLRVLGDERVRVDGFVSTPGDDRPDRRAQILFVNGRLLRSTLVSGAWSAAYRTFAMVGRHPYGVLFLDVPASEVDPNVHPTKSDVRVRYGERIVSVVKESIATALRAGAVERLNTAISYAPPVRSLAPSTEWTSDAFFDPSPDAASSLRVLAQVDRTFILATDGTAVVLIDQHAAHERIVYETLAENADGHAPAEPLLIPHTFELAPEASDKLVPVLEALAASGLEIESFGERAYRIVATPANYIHAGKTRTFDVGDFLECLSDDVRGLDDRQRIWASLACHSVVRAGEALQMTEMTTLLERLMRCTNPMHCPHGRPTIVRLEPDAVARLFKRM
jgi:DNA mismatch repair protein MutL